jgi:putative SbcD/Mre11-related phosphoesterase
MDLSPVHNEPALYIRDTRTLVLADLHIGIEFEIFSAGARIPGKTCEMRDRIMNILKKHDVERLVILGDLKHNVPTASFTEAREIPRLVNDLHESVGEIHLVPGNHDGGIRNYLPDIVQVHSSRGVVIDGVGMWHGHTWPSAEVMTSDMVVVAHNHPAAVFVDGVGARSSERCWLRGKWNRKNVEGKYPGAGKGFVMLPAFNDLCGSSYVNEERQRLIGTVFRKGFADIDKAEIFLLDSTHLGRVADNRVKIQRSK